MPVLRCFRLELRQFRPRLFPFRVRPGQPVVHFHQFVIDLYGAPARRVGLRLFQFRRQFLLARFQFRNFLFESGDTFLNSAFLPRTRLPLLGFDAALFLAINRWRSSGGRSSTTP